MKSSKKYLLWSVLIKAFGVLCGFLGLALTFLGSDGFVSSSQALLYFTIQSNLWAFVIMSIFLWFSFRAYGGHPVKIPRWLFILKYVLTVSIALTFIVFALLLSPFMPADYLLSTTNLCMHFLAPLAAIGDFIFFDSHVKLGKKDIFLAWIPPLYYLIFALTLSFAGVTFAGGAAVPYYFLDYSTLGWFAISDHGLGIVYWMILMLALVSGIALGLIKLSSVIAKKRSQATVEASAIR